MTKRTITMKAFEAGDEIMLYLTDSGGQKGVQSITTLVNPGDEIIWQLEKTKSNIIKIVSIEAKSPKLDVFGKKPERVNDAEFKGTIATDAKGVGAYNITYEYKNKKVVVDDPFIEVKP